MQTKVTLKDISNKAHPFHSYYEQKHHEKMAGTSQHGYIYNKISNTQGNNACHSGFAAVHDASHSWNNFIGYEKVQPFLSWITDETLSPWRDVLDGSTLLYDNANRLMAIFVDAKHDLWITCNFYIACRQAEEFRTIDRFKYFNKLGLNPSMSFFLCEVLVHNTTKGWYYAPNPGHHSLTVWKGFKRGYNQDSEDFNFKHYFTKSPINKKESYNKSGGSAYCNFIWNDSNINISEIVKEYFTSKGVVGEIQKGRFGNHDTEYYYFNTDSDYIDFQDFIFKKYNIEDKHAENSTSD